MSFPGVMDFVTGALQFAVAGYALRLNRILGTARVGWSLFWAFSLLALLHLFQSVISFNNGTQLGVEIEVIYSFISLLLLTGMVHIETLAQGAPADGTGGKAFTGRIGIKGPRKDGAPDPGYRRAAIGNRRTRTDGGGSRRAHKELLVASRQAGMAEIANRVCTTWRNPQEHQCFRQSGIRPDEAIQDQQCRPYWYSHTRT